MKITTSLISCCTCKHDDEHPHDTEHHFFNSFFFSSKHLLDFNVCRVETQNTLREKRTCTWASIQGQLPEFSFHGCWLLLFYVNNLRLNQVHRQRLHCCRILGRTNRWYFKLIWNFKSIWNFYLGLNFKLPCDIPNCPMTNNFASCSWCFIRNCLCCERKQTNLKEN